MARLAVPRTMARLAVAQLFGAAAAAAAAVQGANASKQPKTPHILFLLADDYGWNDIGYHANHSAVGYLNTANPSGEQTTSEAAGMMRTPTLDQLAHEGRKLEGYYVQPLCSPTRSTIMTGRYASHTGIGPDVLVENVPYGTPAREVFMAEYIKKAGYRTHAVGKWHLGKCDNRYMATYRGFDSYQGYLDGAQSYWNHAGDYRNSTTLDDAGKTPVCSTPAQVNGIYSGSLESAEVARIVENHPKDGTPLFVYMALHSVHGPNEDPFPIVDVNETFPAIVDYQRRIFAGMVLALDKAVENITTAYKNAGLWQDTVTVFSTDNGGVSSGNNFPLRGCKVLNWEGGVHGIGFVRGTDSSLAPVPAGSVTTELMHTTDWLPTLVNLAGGDVSGSALPLDGHDQWPTIAHGKPTTRKFIIHNVPITADPVLLPPDPEGKGGGYSTSACLSNVDNRTGPCHGFGLTGGAIRMGDLKLLVSHPGRAPWEDSSPAGIGQGLPGGRYPNGTTVFTPTTPTTLVAPVGNVYDAHLKRNITVYLFNISADPHESNNLAGQDEWSDKLKELLNFYNSYAAAADTVMALSWRYGFQDPHARTVPPDPEGQHCTGEFNANGGSPYCHFGQEWECFVRGRQPSSSAPSLGSAPDAVDTVACQAACKAKTGCTWWVLRNSSSVALPFPGASQYRTEVKCELYGGDDESGADDCVGCDMGPAECPGMSGAPQMRAMTQHTIDALASSSQMQEAQVPWAADPQAMIDEIGRLDSEGYFGSTQRAM